MMESFFPPAAAAHAGRIDFLVDAVHVLMLLLFVGWIIFFFYLLVRFRRSKNPTADYQGVKSKTNNYLEIGVAVVEAFLLLGLSIPMWAERVDDFPDDADATVLRVIAQQFAWNVWYPGADGMFGEQEVSLVNEQTNPIGLVREGPGADDIVKLNQLRIPVEKPAVPYTTLWDASLGLPPELCLP